MKIESGVPAPYRLKLAGRSRGKVREVIDNLNVGDSVFFECGELQNNTFATRIRGTLGSCSRSSGARFTTEIPVEKNGIRIWRVE